MNNYLFFGASLGDFFFLGQSIHMYSLSVNSVDSQTSELSMQEIGPRFVWFLDDAREWNISFAYHPYAKGERVLLSSSTTEKISGSSMVVSFAYQLKLTKSIHLGASINYFTLSVTEKTADEQAEEVSQSYSGIMPMFDLSIRFR